VQVSGQTINVEIVVCHARPNELIQPGENARRPVASLPRISIQLFQTAVVAPERKRIVARFAAACLDHTFSAEEARCRWPDLIKTTDWRPLAERVMVRLFSMQGAR
jgi:hypothetical protein